MINYNHRPEYCLIVINLIHFVNIYFTKVRRTGINVKNDTGRKASWGCIPVLLILTTPIGLSAYSAFSEIRAKA